jgi:ferredoxin-NADP reductase
MANRMPESIYRTKLLNRSWLSKKAAEIEFSRPSGFTFLPGQRIRFIHESKERDYSLISTPQDAALLICVRHIKNGFFSPILCSAEIGTPFRFEGPQGYFSFRPSSRPVVFVATGTGVAPFVSMAGSGVSGFTLLHGVHLPEDLYYSSIFRTKAKQYVPCLTGTSNRLSVLPEAFYGRVTDYLETRLSVDVYDFYLCGRSDMIRDATLLVDDKFHGSYIYSEIFY